MNADLALKWLQRAKSNLVRAQLGRQTPDIAYEDLCFDAQQAVEKALKGVMASLGMEVPPTHSIAYLTKSLEISCKMDMPEFVRQAAILTDYAVTTRYPGDWEPIDEAEYKRAVGLAGQVYEWAAAVTQQAGPCTVEEDS